MGRLILDPSKPSAPRAPRGRLVLEEPATPANFDEAAYLAANPDVAEAVRQGALTSGLDHFRAFGQREGRRLRHGMVATAAAQAGRLVRAVTERLGTSRHGERAAELAAAKAAKLVRIEPLLRTDLPCDRRAGYPDFLSAELRAQFDIVDTDNVSSNDYDDFVLKLIERHADGMVLDCGAGRRAVYFDNVVNFEIAPYDTTDVRGVGEALPFVDAAFDAVISIAVLEHVKDPFQCAREIARVLKPGGELICCVPFLQPYHGYPHHYYNMSHQGIANLFSGLLAVEGVEVYASVLPIWSLSWIVQSWAAGLSGAARQEFLDLRVADLMEPAATYLQRRFVTELPPEKNRELASATVLFARKPGGRQ
jgi:SAM-dependent methyltransferase